MGGGGQKKGRPGAEAQWKPGGAAPGVPPAPLPSVPLADLVRRHGREGRNSERYRLAVAVFQGRTHPGALLADVAAAPRGAREAWLRVPLDGRYERLTATLARDDVSAARGRGAAHFEVYGDGRLLFRTAAPLVPPGSAAGTTNGGRVRSEPEPVTVAVRGVRRLEMVTRYAADRSQEGAGVATALGCVWADALLFPAAAGDSRPGDRREALRAALRPALLRLASAARGAKAPASPAAPATRLPLALAVHVTPAPPGGARTPDVGDLRAALSDASREPRFGGSPVFAPLDRRRSGDFERAVRRGSAVPAAAREAGASAVLTAVPVTPRAGAPWSLTLRLLLLPTPGSPAAPASPDLPVVTVTLPVGG